MNPRSKEIIDSMESTIEEVQRKIIRLSQEVNSNTAQIADRTKNQIESTILSLDEKKDLAERKLLALKQSSSDATEDLMVGTKMALTDLKGALETATERF